jgi:hypothetical protein
LPPYIYSIVLFYKFVLPSLKNKLLLKVGK